MSIFKKLFNKKYELKEKKTTIIYQSKQPEYIDAANKIFRKEYDSAISDLKKLLNNTKENDFNERAMIHINLMEAYFKNRNSNEKYFELSTHHAKEALKCGHNTGLAPYRLIVNLEKMKKFNEAIEVCKIVTSDNYKFSPTGYKQKPEFKERLEKLMKKIDKVNIRESEGKYFNDEEIKMTIENSNSFSLF